MGSRTLPGAGPGSTSGGGRSEPIGSLIQTRRALSAVAAVAAVGLGGLAQATHTVVAGDTLTKIAARYRSTVKAIAEANGIANPRLIVVGRKLTIPDLSGSGGGGPAPRPSSTQHTVASGENLTMIAKKYGSTVRAFVEVNELRNPSLIRPGQVLKVPAPPGVDELLTKHAQAFNVSPALVKAIAWHESGWKQEKVSKAGAVGVMQLLPQTADFTARELLKGSVDINNVDHNVKAGVRFFAYLLEVTGGDKRMALAGYFAGLRNVRTQGISTATERYIGNVLALEQRFGG
jgi:LysM repeat protein